MTALGDMLTPAHRIVGIGPEAILYLHGVGGDRTSFDAQIGAGGPGFAHIAWDMPGYGDSAALPDMTFAALAEAALRLIDALHIERAHVVGHSMGGMIAQELAAGHQDRVASLVLSATSPAFGKAGGDWQQDFWPPAWRRWTPARPRPIWRRRSSRRWSPTARPKPPRRRR